MALFCYALLCVHSSFAIILKRKRKLVALLILPNRCIVTINFCGSSPRCRVGWSAVCVVFLDHAHLFFSLQCVARLHFATRFLQQTLLI